MDISTAVPAVGPLRARDAHGVTSAPMRMPVVVPTTVMRLPWREPVIVIVGRGAATGVTTLEEPDTTDQPAPVSAFTVNVYVMPFVRPTTSHDSADVRHTRAPGDDIT